MSDFATWFLYVVGVVFLVGVAVPLLVAPLGWARGFRWVLPERADLAVYFGRSLGAVGMVLIYAMFRAAGEPSLRPLVFEMATLAGALLCAVHVVGWAKKQQPSLETAEIPVYAALAIGCAWIRAHL